MYARLQTAHQLKIFLKNLKRTMAQLGLSPQDIIDPNETTSMSWTMSKPEIDHSQSVPCI